MYRTNTRLLRNPNLCVGCFEFYLATAPKYSTFAIFLCAEFSLAQLFLVDWVQSCFIFAIFLRLASFWGRKYGSFIWVLLQWTWGTLDSGIAVQSYTGTQMWINSGIAFHSTEKHQQASDWDDSGRPGVQ